MMLRKELKKKIPHGYSKIIAEKAGVSPYTVSLFFNEKSDNLKVEMAALEILAELENKKRELISQIL